MNKYALMLAGTALIATAPVYYAFQAQADETPAPATAAQNPAPTAADEAEADEAEAQISGTGQSPDSAEEGAGITPDTLAPAAGEPDSAAPSGNE